MVEIREYRADDRDDVITIWHEVGWVDRAEDNEVARLDAMLSDADAEVAIVDGHAECFVHRVPGDVAHTGTLLPMSAVSAVTTSHVGRRMGLASTLTARAVAAGARDGAAVSMLGAFEQGFYNRMGFGMLAYEHELTFDPTTLNVGHVPYRRPERFSADDHVELHASMAGRLRSHGTGFLASTNSMHAELMWLERAFILGYRTDGRVSHFIAGEAKGERNYRAYFVAYETLDQLMELLRLVNELGDQLLTFTMVEPPEIQLQDLIEGPMRQRRRSQNTAVNTHWAESFMQLRINDVDAVVSAIEWLGPPVTFNVSVTDPVASFDVDWRGAGGDYTITLGAPSSARRGHAADASTLTCSIGALSRMLFGVLPASSLAVTDDLAGPPDLLARLDVALRMPTPHSGWDF